MVSLYFQSGTIEIREFPKAYDLPLICSWDVRTASHRAPARGYAEIIRSLVRQKIPYEDHAKAYQQLELCSSLERKPHPYQEEALHGWLRQKGQGVVVLPTGSGKTYLAIMAMLKKQRSTLVVAPTLELVRQWHDLLAETFTTSIGVIGGGDYDPKPITVTTYDSAFLHMEHLGNKFGLIIFDECHHLPSESYTLAAQFCLAPYRLGLTATPERMDGQEQRLYDLIGPLSYRKDINELSGPYLAQYDTVRIIIPLSEQERTQYEEARAIYRNFIVRHGIRMADPDGWSQFIIKSTRSQEGQRAMEAYRKQRELALAAPGKFEQIGILLTRHGQDQVLLFTQDNATAYEVSRKFLVPVITHQTRLKERSEILAGFRAGRYGAIATSKVLNEGVDVPEANVAIVISGSGSVREHVQRLGRILRKKADKHAILYELISENTTEGFMSQRRREHVAYR